MANPPKKYVKPGDGADDAKRTGRPADEHVDLTRPAEDRVPDMQGLAVFPTGETDETEGKDVTPAPGAVEKKPDVKPAPALTCCGQVFATRELYDEHRAAVHANENAEQAPIGA